MLSDTVPYRVWGLAKFSMISRGSASWTNLEQVVTWVEKAQHENFEALLEGHTTKSLSSK